MLRIALAAVLVPALAHAAPPGMTPPDDPTVSNVPAPTDPAVSNLPPSTFAPTLYPSAPMGPGPELPLPPPEVGTPSYRRFTLGFDLATVGLFVLGANEGDGGIVELSLATYVLGTPLVHVAMRRPGRALASVSMRLALPIVGAFLGDAMRTHCMSPECEDLGDEGPSGEAVLGFLVGATAAMVVDTAFLAEGDAPKAPPKPQWGPTLHASQGGFSLGAAGSF